mgnify:CR=1 FL=1
MKSIKYLLFAFVICFVAFTQASAKVCTYTNGDVTLRCNTSTGSFGGTLTCGLLNANYQYASVNDESGSDVTIVNSAFFSRIMTLKASDFASGEDSDCSLVPTVYIDYNVISAPISYEIYDIRKDASCRYHNLVYENNKETVYSTAEGSSGCMSLTLSGSGESPSTGGGTSGAGEETGTGGATGDIYDTSNFCSGAVLNVFNVIGWIIVIVKILVPILLIIFGSIDFAKAVIASKDDEIKKSAKTLVMRVIAGIIIFFIPSLLNFVVELIGGSDIYNENSGTFARCTHCMLDPNDCRE